MESLEALAEYTAPRHRTKSLQVGEIRYIPPDAVQDPWERNEPGHGFGRDPQRLKPGTEIGAFRASYMDFVEHMRGIDLVEGTSPIGRRQSDTKMDTDNERDHQYFVVMSFRDRAQVNAAYAKLVPHEEPEESAHWAVYSRPP